eukprot:XP_015575461.1 uncharacterized protein LOC107261349 [Ricinus communis]
MDYQSGYKYKLFYNGLNLATNHMENAAAGGSLSSKTPEQAQSLIEKMVTNNYQWHTTRSKTGRQGSVDSSRKVEDNKTKEPGKEEAKKIPLREYQPKILYPTRLKQAQVEQQFSKFLNNKLPEKKHDPGTFTILCVIGDLTISDALADLGPSINVMSYNLFAKLGLREPKPTRMSIQLADKSVKYPKGIVENLQEMLVEDPLQVTLPMEDEHELSNEKVLE